jgi:uncharacterized damage-inducible protein DinB
MKLKLVITLLASLAFFGHSYSQNADVQIQQMLKDWERAKVYTKEYLDSASADVIDFKPTPEVRSFAEQMLHIADDNYLFASLAVRKKSPYKPKELESKKVASKEELAKIVTDSYDYVISMIKQIGSDAKLLEVLKLPGYEGSNIDILNKGFEHQTHHRGQTTLYLRLKGIKPPDERLF